MDVDTNILNARFTSERGWMKRQIQSKLGVTYEFVTPEGHAIGSVNYNQWTHTVTIMLYCRSTDKPIKEYPFTEEWTHNEELAHAATIFFQLYHVWLTEQITLTTPHTVGY